MATTDQAIEKLIEAVKWLYAFNIHGLATGVNDIIKTNKILADLNAISSRDSSAGTAEIELCGACKQRPCGCKKKCDHEECATWPTCRWVFPPSTPADKPCEHKNAHCPTTTDAWQIWFCKSCHTMGRRLKNTGMSAIEWWPSPTPTAPEDQVPPWEAMNKSLDEWMCDYCGTEATRGIDFLIAQRDALRSRQNEVAKEVLKELQGLVNANRYHAGWIDAKLASLGGA